MSGRGLRLAQLFLIVLILAGRVPVHAGWVVLDKDYLDPGRQTLYFDPDTIGKEGRLVTVWQLTDYKMMQGSVGFGRFMMSPHRFFSTKTQKQLDCDHKRVRLLSYTEFTHHMGAGAAANGYVDNAVWFPIEPESINYALWEVLCGQG